jgi:ABC-type branched-subunit amino acid transport system ATPase component
VHRKIRECALGFVPQLDNVFNNLTVAENLQTGGQFLPPGQRKQRMAQLAEHYPVLHKKWQSPASALSGGERQILALARALMPEPAVLLLDEPSAGLSPKMLTEVFSAIQTIRRQEKVTILMVEQNAMEALHISDRAYVLALGKVAMEGSARDLLDDPVCASSILAVVLPDRIKKEQKEYTMPITPVIDHAVINVDEELDQAQSLFQRMGFQLSTRGTIRWAPATIWPSLPITIWNF